MQRIRTEADLKTAIEQLIAVEPRFSLIHAKHGVPPLRHIEPGLRSLLRIVTDQLISLKAGEAIWKRIEADIVPFEPSIILERGEAGLRKLGLSGSKARTFLAAAEVFARGRCAHEKLDRLADQEAAGELMSIKGIGPWTAQIYLLTALRAADAWAAGDLALQIAAQDLFGIGERPSAKTMDALAEPWRPWRAAAARLLWSHYRGLKAMPQAII
jgi:DNA-3-methyladenine glycosylase II